MLKKIQILRGSRQTDKEAAGARAAIKMHSRTRNTTQLWHDLCNAPYHVFGERSKCNPDFCKVKGLEMVEINEDHSPVNVSPDPTAAAPLTLTEQLESMIQQEQGDDLSPSSLPSQDEEEARWGYTASLDKLPEGLLFRVLHAVDHLVSLTPQLIDNQTSNLAELYMGIRTQLDGGKNFN